MNVFRWFADELYPKILELLFPDSKMMMQIRESWGKPIEKVDWHADRYFRFAAPNQNEVIVDDKTWKDLEFPRIFADASGTVSSIGAQVLYRQMRVPSSSIDELASRHKLHLDIQSNIRLREALQKQLLVLRKNDSAWVSEYLFAKLSPLPSWRLKINVWGILSFIVPAILFLLQWPIWPWFLILLINVVVLVRIALSGRVSRDIDILQSCLRLGMVADNLSAIDDSLLDGNSSSVALQIAKLRDERMNRDELRKSLLFLWLLKLPIIKIVSRLLNVAVLFELNAHMGAMRRFALLRSNLSESFKLVGEIDAAIGVASWLTFRPGHCFPELVVNRKLRIEKGRHPLLEGEQVVNSIFLSDRSVLVTGSNMAGKTTFIKMLGINSILAQTLGFCFASAATIPFSDVKASIHTEHSVEKGLSHYMSETQRIKSFLNRSLPNTWNIFVLDELFSGTNTTERIAIAQAVLRALSLDALVLATTHDVELQNILDGHYDFYYFQEDPDVDGFFDYQLRPGKTSARNAIRLLAELDFPSQIISDAQAFVNGALQETLILPCGSLNPTV